MASLRSGRVRREKHQQWPIFLAPGDFFLVIVHPIVVGRLRVVSQRLIADEDHFAARALDDVPGVSLEDEPAIGRAAERTGALG